MMLDDIDQTKGNIEAEVVDRLFYARLTESLHVVVIFVLLLANVFSDNLR